MCCLVLLVLWHLKILRPFLRRIQSLRHSRPDSGAPSNRIRGATRLHCVSSSIPPFSIQKHRRNAVLSCELTRVSLVPRPYLQYEIHTEFRTASDEHTGPGNEAKQGYVYRIGQNVHIVAYSLIPRPFWSVERGSGYETKLLTALMVGILVSINGSLVSAPAGRGL